jgi:hypothetical protein
MRLHNVVLQAGIERQDLVDAVEKVSTHDYVLILPSNPKVGLDARATPTAIGSDVK